MSCSLYARKIYKSKKEVIPNKIDSVYEREENVPLEHTPGLGWS